MNGLLDYYDSQTDSFEKLVEFKKTQMFKKLKGITQLDDLVKNKSQDYSTVNKEIISKIRSFIPRRIMATKLYALLEYTGNIKFNKHPNIPPIISSEVINNDYFHKKFNNHTPPQLIRTYTLQKNITLKYLSGKSYIINYTKDQLFRLIGYIDKDGLIKLRNLYQTSINNPNVEEVIYDDLMKTVEDSTEDFIHTTQSDILAIKGNYITDSSKLPNLNVLWVDTHDYYEKVRNKLFPVSRQKSARSAE